MLPVPGVEEDAGLLLGLDHEAQVEAGHGVQGVQRDERLLEQGSIFCKNKEKGVLSKYFFELKTSIFRFYCKISSHTSDTNCTVTRYSHRLPDR